jgi:Tat protein translocase TatB subunit
MFGLGISEVMVILAVALIVIGPKNLPKVARTLGRFFGQAQMMVRDFQDAVSQEASEMERSTENDYTDVKAEPASPELANQDAAPSMDPRNAGDSEDSDVTVLHDKPYEEPYEEDEVPTEDEPEETETV